MSKKVAAIVKLQIEAGKANPAPPIGPALGARGANIMMFCKEFNARTQKQAGDVLPTVITIYVDKSFSFITKIPPATQLIKKAIGLAKGSKNPGKEECGSITAAQIREVAKTKMADLNTVDAESAYQSIKGSARSMGLKIVE